MLNWSDLIVRSFGEQTASVLVQNSKYALQFQTFEQQSTFYYISEKRKALDQHFPFET